MRHASLACICGFVFCLSATSGCSSDEAAQPQTPLPDAAADTAPDAVEDAASEADAADPPVFRVTVMQGNQFDLTQEVQGDYWIGSGSYCAAIDASDPQPVLQGATVGFDQAGAARAEVLSAADGTAVFDEFDPTAGTVTVSVFAPDMVPLSVVGVPTSGVGDDADVSLGCFVSPVEFPATVTMSGTLTNRTWPTSIAVLSTNAGFRRSTVTGVNYSLFVEPGKPFSLSAVEVIQSPPACPRCWTQDVAFARVDHDAIDSAAVLDVDLGDPATKSANTEVGVTVELPPRADSILYAKGIAGFRVTAGAGALVGIITTSELSADGKSFAVGAGYATWPGSDTIITRVALQDINSTGIPTSFVLEEGYPQDGAVYTFLDMPTIIQPEDVAVAGPVTEPIAWTAYDDYDQAVLHLFRQKTPVWVIHSWAQTDTLALPQPPASIDVSQLLGSTAVSARIILRRELQPKLHVFRQMVSSLRFSLAP